MENVQGWQLTCGICPGGFYPQKTMLRQYYDPNGKTNLSNIDVSKKPASKLSSVTLGRMTLIASDMLFSINCLRNKLNTLFIVSCNQCWSLLKA